MLLCRVFEPINWWWLETVSESEQKRAERNCAWRNNIHGAISLTQPIGWTGTHNMCPRPAIYNIDGGSH